MFALRCVSKTEFVELRLLFLGCLIFDHSFVVPLFTSRISVSKCIRSWRTANAQDESKSCPLCRVFTPFVTPSTIFLAGPEKFAAIEKYKEALAKQTCKWWNFGDGTCPFGTSCLYLHTDKHGNVVESSLRMAKTSEGNGVVLNQVKLSDFLFKD